MTNMLSQQLLLPENLTKLCLFSCISDSNCCCNMKRGFQHSFAELKYITFKGTIWQHWFRIATLRSLIIRTIYFVYFIFDLTLIMWASLMAQWIVFLHILRSFSNSKVQKCFLHPSIQCHREGLAQFWPLQVHKYISTWVFEYLLQGLDCSTKY